MTDSIDAITQDQDAQAAWLRALAQANHKKSPKVAAKITAAAQELELIMGRVAKLLSAEGQVVDQLKQANKDLSDKMPPPARVLDDADVTAITARLSALGLDSNGDPIPQQA